MLPGRLALRLCRSQPTFATASTRRAGFSTSASATASAAAAGQQQQPPPPRPTQFDYDVGIVGGGIVGLATAREILLRSRAANPPHSPPLRVLIVEKEAELAQHQSKNNSGVIHGGIYYKPGTKRAKLCVEGLHLMYKYCDDHGIPYNKCGKVIAAITEDELPRLQTLYERGLANETPGLRLIGPEEARRLEPHLKCLKAIHSPSTGIVDFSLVAASYAKEVQAMGGQIRTSFEACDFARHGVNAGGSDGVRVTSADGKGSFTAQYLIACAGLHSDRVALKTGGKATPAIVPFRGEWLVLKPEYRHLVNSLIYPVPDPRYPWLGVHFTKKMNGDVWLGPNAVLATAREGYSWFHWNLRDLFESLSYRGLQKLIWKDIQTGIGEVYRSLFKSANIKMLQAFVPEMRTSFIQSGRRAGVRALALEPNGTLCEDFVFDSSSDWKSVLHVRNAPSPGATASLAIAKVIADMAAKQFAIGLRPLDPNVK